MNAQTTDKHISYCKIPTICSTIYR